MALLNKSLYGIEEDSLPFDYENTIKPLIDQKLEVKTLQNPKGLKIRWAKMSRQEKALGTILLLQGRTEDIEKYREVIYDLYLKKYNVVTLDWVGQGGSDHLSKVSSEYGHLDDFDSLRRDLELLLSQDEVKSYIGSQPLFIIAHSMGANVATLFLQKNPEMVDKAALVSPMYDIITKPFPEWLALYVLKILELVGLGDDKAIMSPEFSPSEANNVTTSKIRRDLAFNERVGNKKHLVGPPTNSYGRAALEATRMVKENANKIKTPVLMFQAGVDKIVETKGQDEVCNLMQDCRKILYKNGMHELMMEQDYIRTDLFDKVDKFFKTK